MHFSIFVLIIFSIDYAGGQDSNISFIQHPISNTFCEGDNGVLSCVVEDSTTSDSANTTGWFMVDTSPVIIQPNINPKFIINNTRNADVVTSILIIQNLSSSDNGDEYFCSPLFGTRSNSGIISVTAPPMTAPTITGTTPLSSPLFTVSWTITDPNHNYIITWTNLCTGMIEGSLTVPENTNSYTVTRLNGIDNYNVSVTANNSCGMMMSDPITVYNLQTSAPMNVRFPRDNITSQTFVVQWDAVTELAINYSVRWYEVDGNNGTATVIETAIVNGTSYTVTGLTANKSYNVTVAAIYCEETGPPSANRSMTNIRDPTPPPTSSSPPTSTVLQSCTITSPSASTIRISCEFLERIRVTISSNSCTCSQPITMVDNNPITVPDLPIGVYTVEVTAVNSNDMSIENNRIVEMITISDKSTATDESDSSSLSTGAAVAIGCVITLLVSVTVTTIVTAVIMYILMKRKIESTPQDNINKVLYEEVTSPSHTSKNDVELQQNPAYDTGSKVVMDTNPAYESYK